MLEGFTVRNFRSLRDVTLGKSWLDDQGLAEPLTPMTAVIGKNGTGKSTLMDAFGFLSDCLKFGVEEACYMRGRGGFDSILSQGARAPIQFHVSYQAHEACGKVYFLVYKLEIEADKNRRPFVLSESLRQQRDTVLIGNPFYSFLLLVNGEGFVWHGESGGVDDKEFDQDKWLSQAPIDDTDFPDAEMVQLDDNRKLGIATLGALKQHPRIAAFRRFIEGWYLSYFTPDAARSLPLAGPQARLSIHGDNLANVVQFMQREHPQRFGKILDDIARKIPGVEQIRTERTEDGRLLLKFNDRGFKDPFYAQQMSDGTLKVFAYLLLLADPNPPSFLCIEEPENGVYHKLLDTLAVEFRAHATGEAGGSQVFVTTHQPYFVDALLPEEVWILEKGRDGFSTARRASDDELVKNLVEEELPLGSLWYSDYLDAR